MKASLYYGQRDLRVEEIAEPEVRPGTVKIKVEWTGICGTDLHEYEDGPTFCPAPGHPHPLTGETVPVVLGHEMAGVVAEVGEGVTHVKPGDRVAVEPYITCGECEYCVNGPYNLCVKMGYYGLSGWGGGFAEYVVVGANRVFDLGEISTEVGALVEPLSVAHHAIRRSGAKPGDSVAVFGAGPIGLFIISILKALGIDDVYSVELSSVRKEKAKAAGVVRVLDPSVDDVVSILQEATGGYGVNVAFEAVGASPALQAAIDATRSGGTVVNVSIWSKKAEIDMFGLVMREITLKGTSAYKDDHADVIELLQSGKLTVEQFITGRIAAEDVGELGIRQLIENKDENVKIIVHP
ncbi:2,3-butanediol dehydrogenase [Herbiconiux sp.]|uniref:2,3-butanediol dehydrogenase n=1 Tax=Herbiconiux sp. TaxID=1871186 RepID=UPI0025C2EEAC|nr:2,3-butanediol dehydrogenase [Herbiconiux sp.]